MPVQSPVRSKIASPAILGCDVAERVDLTTLMGHKRMISPMDLQDLAPGKFLSRLPS
jgi:hypothetical protein